MAKEPKNVSRLRFTVPDADLSVLEWISHQSSLSHSIRALIKRHIEDFGMTDPTCETVSFKRRRGRPSANEFGNNDESNDYIDDVEDTNQTIKQVVQVEQPTQTIEPPSQVPQVPQVPQPIVTPIAPTIDETTNIVNNEETNNEDFADMATFFAK